ncbi:MAG: Ca-activated chloride channel family protein [Paraglaciecola psychrophila]|jgi:Ca-activated chloride channel family protein
MIEFVYPLFALLVLLPPTMLLLSPYRRRVSAYRVPFFASLQRLSGERRQSAALLQSRSPLQKGLLVIAWLCLVTALMKPEWVAAPVERNKAGRDLLVAVDLSGSMAAKDFVANTDTGDNGAIDRLTALKQVLIDFVAEREHDRLGLIVFADAPYLQVPLSEDKATWLRLLAETQIGMAGQSTAFGDAIGLAIKLFEGSDRSTKTLIVLTDGNDTGSMVPPLQAAIIAARAGITIYPIAIGDPQTQGEERLDIETLQQVATISGGQFFQAMDSTQLSAAHDSINQLEVEMFETLRYRPRQGLHHFPLAVLVGILLLSLALASWAEIKRAAQHKHRLADD